MMVSLTERKPCPFKEQDIIDAISEGDLDLEFKPAHSRCRQHSVEVIAVLLWRSRSSTQDVCARQLLELGLKYNLCDILFIEALRLLSKYTAMWDDYPSGMTVSLSVCLSQLQSKRFISVIRAHLLKLGANSPRLCFLVGEYRRAVIDKNLKTNIGLLRSCGVDIRLNENSFGRLTLLTLLRLEAEGVHLLGV